MLTPWVRCGTDDVIAVPKELADLWPKGSLTSRKEAALSIKGNPVAALRFPPPLLLPPLQPPPPSDPSLSRF